MSCIMCNDNRFELIAKYKAKLIESTNIETSTDEMAVLDNILFRMWQMGWLDRLEQPTIDAVEAVRCGKCGFRYKPLDDDARNEIFCLFMNCTMMKDDFCSRGCKEKSDE